MKVTLDPEQILFVDAVMLMAGVTGLLTVMVILLLFAVVVAKQLALEVSVQVTISPAFNVDEVKALLLVPAFTPFTFH